MIISKDSFGVEIVTITNEDGTTWSGLKSAYDEMQAQQVEHLTEIPTDEPATKSK
jgi:hypothetical protein